MAGDGKRLREALIRSLRERPILLSAEEGMFAEVSDETQQAIRTSLQDMLDKASGLVETDEISFHALEGDSAQQFRRAVKVALSGGSRLTDDDAELFHELGFEKLSEFRSTLYADLGGPAEIPKQDLAIYVSSDDERINAFREALESELDRLPEDLAVPAREAEHAPPESLERTPTLDLPEEDVLPSSEEALPQWVTPQGTLARPEKVLEEAGVLSPEEPAQVDAVSLEIGAPSTEVAERRALSVHDLNPVPRLTAALEAAGYEEQDFGFILRYGRYAPEGRTSDFLVGGLGLAELSQRIVTWLEGQAPMDAQVQVVDEGSGELAVYLLTPEVT
jgi:hypothetical protein